MPTPWIAAILAPMRVGTWVGMLVAGWSTIAAAQPIVEVDSPIVVEMPRRAREPATGAVAAFSGGQLLVVWRRFDWYAEPFLGALVDPTGAIITPARPIDFGLSYRSGLAGYGDGWLMVGATDTGTPFAVPLDHDLTPGTAIPLTGLTAGVLAVGTSGGAAVLVGRGDGCIEATILRVDQPPVRVTADIPCTATSVQVFDDGGTAYISADASLFRVAPDALERVEIGGPGVVVAIHDGTVVRASPVARSGGGYELQLTGLGKSPVSTVITGRRPVGQSLLLSATGWTLYYLVEGPGFFDPQTVHYAQLTPDGTVLANGVLGTGSSAPRWFYAGDGATFAVGDAAEVHTLAAGATTPDHEYPSADVVRSGSWNTGVATAEGAWLIAQPLSEDGEMRPVTIDRDGRVTMQARIPALSWGSANFVRAASVRAGLALTRIEEPGGMSIGAASSTRSTPSFGRPMVSAWALDLAMLDGVPHVLTVLSESTSSWALHEVSGTTIVGTRPIARAPEDWPLQVMDCGDTQAVLARSDAGLVGVELGADGLTDDTWVIGPGRLDGPSGSPIIAVSDPPGQPAVAWLESGRLWLAMLDERCRPISTREIGSIPIPTRLGLAVAGSTTALSWTEPGSGTFRLVLVDGTGVSTPVTLAEETLDEVLGASVLATADDTFLAYWSSIEAGDYVTRPRLSFVRATHPSDDAGTDSDGGLPESDAGTPALDGSVAPSTDGGASLDAGSDGGHFAAGGAGACAVAHHPSSSFGWAMALWAVATLLRRRRSYHPTAAA